MTGNLDPGAGDSWLVPRDTFLALALSGPPPADVRRDLPNILAATAALAHPWRPAALPPAPVPAGPALTETTPVGALPRPAPPRPPAAGSWFRRGPLRFRAGSAA